MSLLFVTDVAASVLLFGHSRRRPRVAILALVVATGLVTVTLGILGHFGTLSVVNVDGGSGGRPYDDPIAGVWIGVVIVGGLVILAAVLVGVIRGSILRNEAQRAANAVDASTESDSSDLMTAD